MLPAIRRELEEMCGAPLPWQWLQFLAVYPEELKQALRSDDGSEEEGCVGDAELLADPGDVLAINQEVRATSILDTDNREFHWPASYIVIGESGDGDYYCIDPQDPNCGVHQFQHLPVQFKRLTKGFADYLEMLLEAYVEFEEDEDWDEDYAGNDGEDEDGDDDENDDTSIDDSPGLAN
ncbi:MAG: SMI1/KNR4 family protein [Planctomycetota bacterium]